MPTPDSEYETTDDSEEEDFCESRFQTWDENQTRVKWLKKNGKYKSRATCAAAKNARNKIQESFTIAPKNTYLYTVQSV